MKEAPDSNIDQTPPAFEGEAKTIQQRLRENGINTEVEVHLHLSPHTTETDAEQLEDKLKNCDIFVPEMASVPASVLEQIEEVSFGKKKEQDFHAEHTIHFGQAIPFVAKLIDMLSDKNIAIVHVDIPTDDPVYAAFSKSKFTISEDPDQSAQSLIAALKAFDDLQEYREQQMATRLPDEILKAFQRHPAFKDKDKVRIVMFLGSAHLGFKRHLDEVTEQKSSVGLAYSPTFYTSSSEIGRRIKCGKEISEDLAITILMDNIMSAFDLSYFTDSTNEESVFVRKITSLFSTDEIRTLWKEVYAMDTPESLATLKRKLTEKGFNLPKTKAEFQAFIGSR